MLSSMRTAQAKGCALLRAVLVLTGLLAVQCAQAAGPPQIGHVFTIVLENENEATSFGPGSPAPYLGVTLPAAGAFVPNYFGIGHASLDNYVAMISGQPPNTHTQADYFTFSDMLPGTLNGEGIALGGMCLPPA